MAFFIILEISFVILLKSELLIIDESTMYLGLNILPIFLKITSFFNGLINN
ncbi:hypothetical protein ES708_11671 [subsurface metagenome]